MPKHKQPAALRKLTGDNLLDDIAAQLRHFSHEEIIVLLQDFLSDSDPKLQARFRTLLMQGPRPLVAEALGLTDAAELLDSIQTLRNDIANDVYVEYGAGFDPEIREYRGFGDDSWIDEMDRLFAATTSLYRAGQFKAAADAYLALFAIFELAEDGFHFTRPNPAKALHTDIDSVKQNLFIAIGRSDSHASERAIELSEQLRYSGDNPYALLDAWNGRVELMGGLEKALLARARHKIATDRHIHLLPHASELLREYYRRYRTLPEYEGLCRDVGAQQGWPYEDLVRIYTENGSWDKVLAFSEDGLAKLPLHSHFRPFLKEARGQALLQLGRHLEALEQLRVLFHAQKTISVYLKLREAASATGKWQSLFPRLAGELEQYVRKIAKRDGYTRADLMVSGLLGYAYLLEGDWPKALDWAQRAEPTGGWADEDVLRIVATGLLLVGTAVGKERDDVLRRELDTAPALIREHGDSLLLLASSRSPNDVLDGAAQMYERLVKRAVDGKNRALYPEVAAHCKVIQAIRQRQGRAADFERYYQGLLDQHKRRWALTRDLRQAIQGSAKPHTPKA